ncbi:MAG: GNAT family N-acetyltransferase [Acidobacteriia bacterium]|nr:GNAT family N-acetyltransferase [Terriglobia bacterium]
MPHEYRIRQARARDLGRILQIENASFGSEAYDRRLFAYYQRNCADLFLVAECGLRICAYLLCCLRGRSAELVSVAVDPRYRAKGAGSALLRGVLRRLRLRGAHRLHLMVHVDNAPALAFYTKYGFRRRRLVPKYYEDGGDAIAMTRTVTLL